MTVVVCGLWVCRSQVKLVLFTKIKNSPLLDPGTSSLRRRQNCALLARVVRSASAEGSQKYIAAVS